MNKHISYNFILIFIIIQCVKSQDNNPDQPVDDEGEEDNFEVLDLEQIIQERIDRFDDPQYQPQYQQLQESQYPTQPQAQPQYYDLDQPETSYDQPEYQYYQPESFQYQPEYHIQPEHYGQYQSYETQIQTQQQQYYQPPTTQTQVTQESQQSQPQPTYQQLSHYVPALVETQQPTGPLEPEVIQVQHIDDEETEKERQPRAQLLEKLKRKIEDRIKTQPTQQTQPRKRKRTRTKAQKSQVDKDDDDEQKPKRGRKPKSYKKSKKLKFYKRNNLGNLEEMNDGDYVITTSDKKKTEYKFNENLEQLECDNEIIYVHASGTPYCSLLSHSRETHVFIMTNSNGFTLVKKTSGEWIRNDTEISDDVKLYKQDSGANDILMTNDDYDIDFTSFGSFRYDLYPGVNCNKIVVKDMIAWEKTEEDDGYPELIYVTPKFTVIVKFNKYTKTFIRKTKKYRLLHNTKNKKRAKYY